MKIIDGAEAFSQTLRNKWRKYPDRQDRRFRHGLLLPNINPKVQLEINDSVFTIGSCFAREVEDVLVEHGLRVPTADFAAPSEEAPGRPNRILNQYNPATMLQCVESIDRKANDHGLYQTENDQVIDALLATGSRPVSYQRATERRRQITNLYQSGLDTSRNVVITLGLVEAWFDRQCELYLNEAPPRSEIKRYPNRFELRRFDVEDCIHTISRLVEKLSEGVQRTIILTVSPVPLQTTFCGGDAVVANSYSKAVLRVAAELVCENFDNVEYFPSFEIVSTSGLSALGDDNVHVRRIFVQRIMEHLADTYLRAPGDLLHKSLDGLSEVPLD